MLTVWRREAVCGGERARRREGGEGEVELDGDGLEERD